MTALVEPSVGGGGVTRPEEAYAREKLARLARYAPRPVTSARIRLRYEPDPARSRPAIAEATIDVDGQPVRAHVAATTAREAVDLVEARLRRRLERLGERARSTHLRHRDARRGGWRHGDPPTHRPEHYDRPPGEREVVRRKAFVVPPETPDDAVLDLELLDHDFLLFRNDLTSEDNVVYRLPDGGYALLEPTPHPQVVEDTVHPISAGPGAVGEMRLGDATRWLDLSNEPFVFFLDPRTHRGNVVYRRYDGHYGLIAPAD